jgi:hypothetical protein
MTKEKNLSSSLFISGINIFKETVVVKKQDPWPHGSCFSHLLFKKITLKASHTKVVINYIILAHREPYQLRRLVEKLSSPHTFFYIHIDLNVDIAPFESLLKTKERVIFLPQKKRVASVWASSGIVKATLNAIEEVIRDNRHGYTFLISGQCYPIKNNKCIYSFLKENYGCNFIEGFNLPDPRWPSSSIRMHQYAFFLSSKREDFITAPSFLDLSFKDLLNKRLIKKYCKVLLRSPLKSIVLFKKRRFPKNLKPYGGMQWWALPLETLKFISRFVAENPGYLKYHLFTLFADEVFFQTIVHNYFTKISSPTTFSPWPGDDSSSSPQTLSTQHFNLLKKRKELFARKFDCSVDTHVLDLIDSVILQEEIK